MKIKKVTVSRLREIRGRQGISQKALAETLGLAQNTISQYETGAKTPSLEVAKALSDLLNCTINELIGGNKNG